MTPSTILLADDDDAIRTVLHTSLTRCGYDVRMTGNAATLWKWVSAGEGDLIVTDVVMPDENVFDLLPRIRKIRPRLPVIVMSAQNTVLTAIKAAERGAYEYLPKPFDLNELTQAVGRALHPAQADAPLHNRMLGEEDLPLIGRSAAMQDVYRVLARLMTSDLTVMITGESGTGKELVARALHDYGKRRHGPFVPVNMAAIPRELIESELFGHEKGAFTGATQRTAGRFEQARGGTLFLDEIGDMPLEAQTRLLRVLQEGEYHAVGGRHTVKADVRIIAATNQRLETRIQQGYFRQDLFFRLNVVPLDLPPLRQRLEDVRDLTHHFLTRAGQQGSSPKVIEQTALDAMMGYDWPGNVRELENLILRLSAIYSDDVITGDMVKKELERQGDGARGGAGRQDFQTALNMHLETYFAKFGEHLPPPGLYEKLLKDIERPLILKCLQATKGNQVKAAHLLGLNRNTLRKKMRLLEIRLDNAVLPLENGA